MAGYAWDSAANTLSVELDTNEQLLIEVDGGEVVFQLNLGTFSPDGGDVASGSGTGTIRIAEGDLASSIAIRNTFAAAGNNGVALFGTAHIHSDSITIDVSNPIATSAISLVTDVILESTGDGGVMLAASQSVSINASSSVLTADGDIRLSGNELGSKSGAFNGVVITGAVESTGAGDIVISGRGAHASNADRQRGVFVFGGQILSTGTGEIQINGVGGNGGTNNNVGVSLENGAVVSSTSGDITINATGGNGTAGSNVGFVMVTDATISATGSASVRIRGVGGQGTDQNLGIVLTGAGVGIAAVDGDIELDGTAQDTSGGNNHGVWIFGSAIVVSAGAGNISIVGAAAQASAFGISLDSSVAVAGTTVALVTDRFNLGGSGSVNTAGGSAVIRTKTTNGSIGIALGGADSATQLGVNNTELNRISASTIVIGDSATPNFVTISAAMQHTGDANIAVLTARSIDVLAGGGWTTNHGDLQFAANQGPIATAGTFEGVRVTGTLRANGDADIAVAGRGGKVGVDNAGIVVAVGGEIVTNDGDIELVGRVAAAASSAIEVLTSAIIEATGDADVSLVGDSMMFSGGAIAAEGNTVTLRPLTAGHGIDLGSDDTATTLGLTDAELDRIVAANLVVGSRQVESIAIRADISRSSSTNITLQSADGFDFGGGQIDASGGLLRLLAPGPAGIVRPETASIDAVTEAVMLDADLMIGIDGTTADDDYDRLGVDGQLHLAFSSLQLNGGHVPQPGEVFTIVSATRLVGQFVGLADGATVELNGVELVLNYSDTEVTLSVPRGSDDIIAIGAAAGASPRVKVLDSRTGTMISSFLAYAADFEGGVRVAVGDLNGDGAPEIITAPGPGRASIVKVFSLDGSEFVDFRVRAYSAFRGGVFVATADVNGDGRPDLVTSPDAGIAAEIKVFRNRSEYVSPDKPYAFTRNPLHSFLAFGSSFKGGATIAAGDLNGDSKAEIVVGNGPGMAPRVRVFDLIASPPPMPSIGQSLLPYALEIRPFSPTDRGGVFVAVGDVRGLGSELVVGNGLEGRGRVEMFDTTGARFKSFTAFGGTGPARNAPVHVAAKNVAADALDEILVTQGSPGSVRELRIFKGDGSSVDQIFESDDDFRFGFYVA